MATQQTTTDAGNEVHLVNNNEVRLVGNNKVLLAGNKSRRKRGEREKVNRPADAMAGRIIWPYTLGVIIYHVLLPLAFLPLYFSWIGVAWLFVGNYLFCSCGIGAGYHRLLTHRSYSCPKWFEHTLALLGLCCLQDAPARWVVIHRLHHHHSDNEPDPHSPLVHWFWGHVGWLFVENRELSRLETFAKYAPDMVADPLYRRLERKHFWVWVYFAHVALIVLLGFVVGLIAEHTLLGGALMAVTFLLWGVVARTVYTWHVTWAVNSAAHLWGYRNYETRDNSRNNWLTALATNGEGWHNNHHADPRSAAHGHRWWELDVTYLTLLALRKVGLVWDIVPIRE